MFLTAAVSTEPVVLKEKKTVIIILRDVKVTKFRKHHHNKDMA
jgi:hypothetical protein